MKNDNIVSRFIYKIKREQRKADAAINAPAVKRTVSWMGDNNGVLDSYNGRTLPENYVVVRDYDGNLSVAYNPTVPMLPNLMVNVGYDPLQPTRYMVLGIADYLSVNPSSAAVNHHKLHEWPGGDTVYIHSEQFLPGLLLAGTGLLVSVYPFFFKKNDGSRGLCANQTFDLTSSIPATGAQAFTLVVDDTGALQLLPGSTQISLALITMVDFPTNVDPTLHDLWGIRLFKGQTVVRQTAGYSDVFDFRMGGVQGGGGSGGGSVMSVTGDGVDNADPANPVVSFADLIDGGNAATY